MYLNGSNFVTANNFSYSISIASQGNLVFGNRAQVDFYEVYLYNKAITDYEMDMVVNRMLWKYEIKYKPLRSYLPTGTSDVATKYYADNLPYFRSPASSLLNMNNFRITNVLTPANMNDAANMGWVTSQGYLKSPLVSNLDAGAKFITNLAAPIALSDAVNKSYVDGKIKNYQLLSGVTSFNSTSYNSSITQMFSLINTTGNSGNFGYFWPTDGKVLRLTYNICSATSGCTLTGILALITNTTGITESAHVITTSAQKGMKTYSPAISFVTGDTLSFPLINLGIQSPTTTSSIVSLFVNVLVEYNII